MTRWWTASWRRKSIWQEAGSEAQIEEAAADKGYHANATIELADDLNLRTYIPEPQLKHRRTWADKPESKHRAVLNNRRRTRRTKAGVGSGSAVSAWSGALLTFAKQAVAGGAGFASWSK